METGQEQMPTVQKQWYFHPESNGPFTTPVQGWMDLPLVSSGHKKCRNYSVQILGWFGVLQEVGGCRPFSFLLLLMSWVFSAASLLLFSPLILPLYFLNE